MLLSPTRSLPYCLGGLKTVHGRYVVDGRLFVGTEEPPVLLGTPDPIAHTSTREVTVVSIQARHRIPSGSGAKNWCNHPSQALPSASSPRSQGQARQDRQAEQQSNSQVHDDLHGEVDGDGVDGDKDTGTPRSDSAPLEVHRKPREVIQFRTYEHPRERGGRLFHSLGVGITELLERCIVRQGSLCIVEPVQADWGGFPTATLLMLLGVPASSAAAALAEAFAPLDHQESLRRQVTLTELLNEMEQIYGSSVRFALAHGSDAALLGNLRFAYLAR
jgi:hypothetical protein